MKSKEENISSFQLPDDVVTVKFIKRKKGLAANVDENHIISGGMLSGARKRYPAPLQSNGKVANVLTREEKDYLEYETQLNLSVYGDFWKDFYVTLFKESASNTFNLADPMDYISVKVLQSYTNEIALKWADRTKKSTYQFVITRSNEEFAEKKVKLDSKKLAFKLYGKIEDDRDKLIGVLNLLSNQTVSEDAKLDWVQGKVEDYLDSMPSAFLNIIQDPTFDVKVLIKKGVSMGVILRAGNKYKSADGLDLCNEGEIPSFDNAVVYLSNPKNQEVKSLIIARIDNAK